MKGQFGRTLIIVFYVVVFLLVVAVIYEVAGESKDAPEEAERVNCETACIGETLTGEENIQGCDCSDFIQSQEECGEDEYLCGNRCIHIEDHCQEQDYICGEGEAWCADGCQEPVTTVCPENTVHTACGCAPQTN